MNIRTEQKGKSIFTYFPKRILPYFMYADGCALLVSGALLPSVGETDKSHTDRENTAKISGAVEKIGCAACVSAKKKRQGGHKTSAAA